MNRLWRFTKTITDKSVVQFKLFLFLNIAVMTVLTFCISFLISFMMNSELWNALRFAMVFAGYIGLFLGFFGGCLYLMRKTPE